MAAVEIMDPVLELEDEDDESMHIKNEITQIRNTNREIRLLFAGVIERLQSPDLSDLDRTQQENLLLTLEQSIKESENRLQQLLMYQYQEHTEDTVLR